MNNAGLNQIIYSLVYFFLFAAIAALYPFFPLVLQSKGFDPSRIGFILGSYEFISILGLLVIGHFYDRFRSPRRTILFICIFSIIVLFFISREQQFFLLITLTLALGFVIKSPASLVDAHYGQTMPDSGESYGKARLYGSLGFFAGAMIIQLTKWVEGSRPDTVFKGFTFSLLAAMMLIVLLPAGHHTEEKHHKGSFLRTIRSFPGIYWIGLSITFLSFLGMSGHYTFFSLLLKNRFDTGDIGGAWALGPLFEVPLFFFSGWLLRKLSLKKLWMICLAAGAIRMQVYSLARSLPPLYVVQILHSFSFSFNHMAMITLIGKTSSAADRGLAISIYSAVGMGLSLFLGGFLGGWILAAADYTLLFQIFSLFPLAGIGVALFLFKEKS